MANQYDELAGKLIDNDNHPSDNGLTASQDDHWGTSAKLTDMVARGRTIMEQDRDNSTRAAAKARQ